MQARYTQGSSSRAGMAVYGLLVLAALGFPGMGFGFVGYLLEYSFWNPSVYINQGDLRLSGWQTNLNGGSIDYSKNSFAGTYQWFKVTDNSTTAGVSYYHKLVSQARGVITMEYAFSMPKKMDGVAVQLMGGNTVGLKIVTSGGSLGYENANGAFVSMQAYDANRSYGVRAVVDVSAKRADIYVDGVEKAAGVAFRNPVGALDFVLVTTGDAATGELSLWPLDIHTGYLVAEKFITAAAGGMPGGWTSSAAGGTCGVQENNGSAKPDNLSLKLSVAGSGQAVSAGKAFPLNGGKTVFEYKFLLPAKADGVAALLRNGAGDGVKIITSGGDLDFAGPGGNTVLVAGYLANFWYMLKIVADAAAGSADVYVNGKPVETGLALNAAVSGFDNVLFSSGNAGLAVVWVDDVRIYPFQEYPADYVPAPIPAAAQSPYILGVQSCSLWKEGMAYAGWDWIDDYASQRKPYLGYFDEGNPEVTDWEIKWQLEHGISYELYCWYRHDMGKGFPIKTTPLAHALHDGLFNAKYGLQKKFAIMWENHLFGSTDMADFQANLVPYWINYYFTDPRYMKVDSKPLFSIYTYENMIADFGGVAGARNAISYLRTACAAAGLPGIIVMMEYRGTDANQMKNIKDLGVDYVYAYTWGNAGAGAMRRSNIAQRNAGNVDAIPSISMGWNTQAWDGGGEWVTVPDYKALAQWAKDSMLTTISPSKLGSKMLMLANWNEFGEGQFLMPSNLHGFGYLDALREVFTAGGAHTDLSPTEAQKSRFDYFYRTEALPSGIDSAGVYSLICVASDKYLTVAKDGTANGDSIVQWDAKQTDGQLWSFQKLDSLYYRIVNKHSGKYLSLDGGNPDGNGSLVHQWEWGNSDLQRWKIEQVSAGIYKITSKQSGKSLSIDGGNVTANGGNVLQWDWVNSDKQKWKLAQAPGPVTLGPTHVSRGNKFSLRPYGNGMRFDFEVPASVGNAAQPVEISLYGINGMLVNAFASGAYPPGKHSVAWEGGKQALAGSGFYLVRLRIGGVESKVKLCLVR